MRLTPAPEKRAPILPMLVADRFDKDALKRAREEGVVPATIQAIFGPEFAAALRELSRALTDALKGALDTVQLASIIKRISTVEGALGNLRGTLFEYIVAEITRTQCPGLTVRMNKLCKGPENIDMEIDVWALGDETARFMSASPIDPGLSSMTRKLSAGSASASPPCAITLMAWPLSRSSPARRLNCG
jgi:hypothetical protein